MKKLISVFLLTTITSNAPNFISHNNITNKKDTNTTNNFSNWKEINKFILQSIKTAGSTDTLDIDNKGNCWITTVGGLLYFVSAASTSAIQIQGIDTDWIPYIHTDNQGNCWIGTDSGLFYVPNDSNNAVQIQGISGAVTTIAYDNNGNCWIGTLDGVYFVSAGSTSAMQIQGIDIAGFNGNSLSIQTDIQGNCWASFPTDNDDVRNENLYFVSAGSTSATKILHVKNDSSVTFLKIDPQGNCWVATESEVYFVSAGSTSAIQIPLGNIITRSMQIDNQGNCWVSSSAGLFYVKTVNSWIKENLSLKTEEKKNLVWLKPDELASNGVVNLKTSDQEINTIKIDGKIVPEVNKQWDFNINNIKEKNKNYNIEINAVIEGQNYNIRFTLSSLLSKPVLSVKTLSSNDTSLKPIWFQKNPNLDLKKPNPVSEAFVATTAVKLNLPNPTSSTSETATIYGLKSDFTKTGNSEAVTKNLQINGNELGTTNGLFEVDVLDSASNSFTYYLQVSTTPTITNFFTTEQGKYFTRWAGHNNYDQKYFDNLLKIDDSDTMNKIISASVDWKIMATDIEIADNIESLLNAKTITNSETGLNSEELVNLIENQLPNSIQIKNEDTTDFNINNIKINVDKPKNGKTYQDNEEVKYTITYNDTIASTSNKIIIIPYVAPRPTKYNYTWVVILASCLVILGLAYLAGWKYGFKKLLLKRKAIKDKLEEAEIIKMMKAEEAAKNG